MSALAQVLNTAIPFVVLWYLALRSLEVSYALTLLLALSAVPQGLVVEGLQPGEAVKAFVVPADGAVLDQDEIIAFCADRMARYKCPSSVSFVDELPRGATGKVVRRQLEQ